MPKNKDKKEFGNKKGISRGSYKRFYYKWLVSKIKNIFDSGSPSGCSDTAGVIGLKRGGNGEQIRPL